MVRYRQRCVGEPGALRLPVVQLSSVQAGYELVKGHMDLISHDVRDRNTTHDGCSVLAHGLGYREASRLVEAKEHVGVTLLAWMR